jgi:hypothetical protein
MYTSALPTAGLSRRAFLIAAAGVAIPTGAAGPADAAGPAGAAGRSAVPAAGVTPTRPHRTLLGVL